MLKLSCANCSAPLEVGDNLERFTCSYCGTAQIVERAGGVISTRKLETAIHAVQRGTDRTAAELAMPRLNRELAEAMSERAALIQAAAKKVERAKNSRFTNTFIAFAGAGIGGLFVIGTADVKGRFGSVILASIWWAAVVIAPILTYKFSKIPKVDTKSATIEIDQRIARIQGHIQTNREILDAVPA